MQEQDKTKVQRFFSPFDRAETKLSVSKNRPVSKFKKRLITENSSGWNSDVAEIETEIRWSSFDARIED